MKTCKFFVIKRGSVALGRVLLAAFLAWAAKRPALAGYDEDMQAQFQEFEDALVGLRTSPWDNWELIHSFPAKYRKVKVLTWAQGNINKVHTEVQDVLLKTLAKKGYEAEIAKQWDPDAPCGPLADDEACLVVCSDVDTFRSESTHTHTDTRSGTLTDPDGGTWTYEEPYEYEHTSSNRRYRTELYLQLWIGSGDSRWKIRQTVLEKDGNKPKLAKWTKELLSDFDDRENAR